MFRVSLILYEGFLMKKLSVTVAMFVVLLFAQVGYGMKKEVCDGENNEIKVVEHYTSSKFKGECTYAFMESKKGLGLYRDCFYDKYRYSFYLFKNGDEKEETIFTTLEDFNFSKSVKKTSCFIPEEVKFLLLAAIEKTQPIEKILKNNITVKNYVDKESYTGVIAESKGKAWSESESCYVEEGYKLIMFDHGETKEWGERAFPKELGIIFYESFPLRNNIKKIFFDAIELFEESQSE